MSLTATVPERDTTEQTGFVGWLRGALGKFYGNNLLVLITFGLLILIYILGAIIFKSQNLGSLNNLFSMINSWPHLVVIAAGMTMVLISGNIDISVGAQVALYCMMMAYLMQPTGPNLNPYVIMVIVLLTGLLFGLVQGVLVAYLRIQPFIVTLAGMFFARGLTAVISEQNIPINNPQFLALSQIKLTLPFGGYVSGNGTYMKPYLFLYGVLALLAVVVVYGLMTWTAFGRSVYAVGGSQQSAMLMGLNPKRITLRVFVIQGLLTAFGAILYCIQSPGGAIEKAQGFEMNAIAAAVIGGALLTGGVGNIIGSLAGVLVQTMVIKMVLAANVADGWGPISTAAMLAFFLAMQSVISSTSRKRE